MLEKKLSGKEKQRNIYKMVIAGFIWGIGGNEIHIE